MGAPTAWGEAFTVDDLERMPDDGHRHELLDGVLLVSPAPGIWHQEVALALTILLRSACPPELHVVIAPFEWRRDRSTALQPDVLVARRDELLAVEHVLVDGRYTEAGEVSGTQQWVPQRPFPVTVCPADLVSGLRPGP